MQQTCHPYQPHTGFSGLPAATGIGLKPQHYSKLLDDDLLKHGGDDGNAVSPPPAWLELHPQNYFGDGGPPHRWLSAIAEHYPLSFHSVGLSLGSADGLNQGNLDKLAALCARYNPAMVSDHLSFSGNAHHRFADLLPIPYTGEALDHFATQIDRVQTQLKCNILIENPSRYLAYADDDMDEVEFIAGLVSKTGCGIIFDINNVEVSCGNLNQSAQEYIDAIDPAWIGEIHLAGHAVEEHDTGPLRIDDHGSHVSAVTWALYERFIERAGPLPTLIEWDTDIPEFNILMAEAQKAQSVLNQNIQMPLTPSSDSGQEAIRHALTR